MCPDFVRKFGTYLRLGHFSGILGHFLGILGHFSGILEKCLRIFVVDSFGIDLAVMHSWMPLFFAGYFSKFEHGIKNMSQLFAEFLQILGMKYKFCPEFLQNYGHIVCQWIHCISPFQIGRLFLRVNHSTQLCIQTHPSLNSDLIQTNVLGKFRLKSDYINYEIRPT